nr:class V chitinase-like isoform X2 [Erigeron canadensis]
MTIFSLLVLLLFMLNTSTAAQTWVKSGYWYAGSEFPVPNINSGLFTHLICAFAFINPSTNELFLRPSDEPFVATFASTVKKTNPSVIPLLSIWTQNEFGNNKNDNSSIFLEMVKNPVSRKSFVESSINMARLYGFEGFDLYIANVLSAKGNLTNLGTLFDEWRAAVEKESLIMIMAGHYSPELDSMSYPVDSISMNFDWVHLRSYDYHTPFTINSTAAHAALYDPSSHVNTDYGLNQWIKRGLPARKLVMGLAYHGYAWTLMDPKNNGIGAPAKGETIINDGSISYEFIKKYWSNGVTTVYNSTYEMNYIANYYSWIGFDDVEAIKNKVAYAKEKGLLGFSVWQVSNDYNWELSKAAAQEEDKYSHSQQALVITLCIIGSVIMLLGSIVCYLRKQIASKVKQMMNRLKSSYQNQQIVSFVDIREATNNFAEENKLGEGGYGPVYKGKLSNGQEIAVKRLSQSSKQGLDEFKNEVTFATKLQHVNLVKLLGFCTEREEKTLIYEFMPNKSLDFYLYDPSRRSMLSWKKWVDIIEGIIQGLLYLQEYSRLTIVHRDLKASNILLDADMKPKISDFGIAKSFQNNEILANTGRIVGT